MKIGIAIVCLMVSMSAGPSLAGEQAPDKLPIVYSTHYDIGLFGLERLHPFDSKKYGKVYKYLVKNVGIDKDRFYEPEIVSEEELLSVHTKEYLNSLNKSANVAKIAEVDLLSYVPNFILRSTLLKPMKYGTGGTILGTELALKYGWAINLSGGYHHAKSDSGGGFCFYADIPIAVYKLFKKKPKMSVLIVDLDAHQGNGYESIFKNDPRIHIMDVYNYEIYPGDKDARKYIEFNYPVKYIIEDEEYLALIEEDLNEAIVKSKPELIIYNAGTDIFSEDPLGFMRITEEGIIKRDEIVFKRALQNNIPVLMLLSGGYTPKSAGIIGRSIENLLKNVIVTPLSAPPRRQYTS